MKKSLTERQMWWRIYSHFRRAVPNEGGMCLLIWDAVQKDTLDPRIADRMIARIRDDMTRMDRATKLYMFPQFSRKPRMAYCQRQIRRLDREDKLIEC